MRPLLITGAGGMLGWELKEHFSKSWKGGPVVALDREALDITRRIQVETCFNEYRPHVVLNAAAYTNVDGAESERELAYAINCMGVANLVAGCRVRGTKLVHFSTDQVFDGTGNIPWSEEMAPRPSNYYAETKWLGEKEAMRAPGALILRVQWLYGKRKDRFNTLRGKTTFTPFADQWGAPTWTRDICGFAEELLNREAQGIFHLSYDDYASWAEVFEFARDVLSLEVQLIPKKTEEVSLPAARPRFSVMSNRKLQSFLSRDKIGSWKDALRAFLSLT
jgi:dTDP-4-dehydrorhamnose reductase